MTPAATALIAQLEDAGKAASRAEEALRERMMRELAVLERRRAFAFRRANLVRALAAAAARATSEDSVAAAQRAAVLQELGSELESDFHRAVLDRLQPVGDIVRQCVRGNEGAAEQVLTELESFEGWYESAYGQSFYALFDQEPLEMPLVEG